MENVKLIIWDLDETFWNGTLSEGGISLIEFNIQLVKELSHRGILNSIVSKNDFDLAKAKLVEAGVWDFFVFPSIQWQPKGQQVFSIIEDCQLRPQNVLFIDDNPINLKEVAFYNEGIQVASPSVIAGLKEQKALEGKKDQELNRLKQYKLLEEKKVVRQSYPSNEEFLLSSKITIRFDENLDLARERVVELVNRSNQLNFTKSRLSDEDVAGFVSQPNLFEQKVIHVRDAFGDYGIVGYYCLEKKSGTLIHFVFSCRIMNLGIEQYIYERLDFPKISVVEPVVSELKNERIVNWITEIEETESNHGRPEGVRTIIFKGGCDLGQMIHYIRSEQLEIIEEGNEAKNNVPLHSDHTQVILDSVRLSPPEKEYLANSLPFVDGSFYRTHVLSGDYDVLIYSVVMDYTMDLYRHKEKGYLIPYGGYYDQLTRVDDHPRLVDKYTKQKQRGFDEAFLATFSRTYECIGPITVEAFVKNLEEIRGRLSSDLPIIFLNGAELDSPLDKEHAATQRHRTMNLALDTFILSHANCFLLDVRKIITHPGLLTNNIRHFSREGYFQLSVELKRILETELSTEVMVKKPSLSQNIVKDFRKYIRKLSSHLSLTK